MIHTKLHFIEQNVSIKSPPPICFANFPLCKWGFYKDALIYMFVCNLVSVSKV